MVVTAVVKHWRIYMKKHQRLHPKLRTIQTRARRFYFNKEENYYQCTKPEGNQAKLLFKGEKRDSKGYTKRTYRSSETDCKTVH